MKNVKRLQNRIAESGGTLTAVTIYAAAVWLLAGVVDKGWWPQLLCFAASIYLMVELSNGNALLRVRSRMVSSVFVAISCAAPFMFGSLRGGLTGLCFVAALLLLLPTYQDKQAVGKTFYAFVCIGLASMATVQTVCYVPLLWILMATQLLSLNWRTWLASIIGLILPYWFLALWFIYLRDFTPLVDHFAQLATLITPPDYATIAPGQTAVFIFTLLLTALGIWQFWTRSFEDKIRIRLLYGLFTLMALFSMAFVALRPSLYDPFMRIAFICSSPLIAHYMTLTGSRISNIVFIVASVTALLITAANLFLTVTT